MDQLRIKSHVDPGIKAAVQGLQPEEPGHGFHWNQRKHFGYWKYYSQGIVVFLVSNGHVDSKLLTDYYWV